MATLVRKLSGFRVDTILFMQPSVLSDLRVRGLKVIQPSIFDPPSCPLPLTKLWNLWWYQPMREFLVTLDIWPFSYWFNWPSEPSLSLVRVATQNFIPMMQLGLGRHDCISG